MIHLIDKSALVAEIERFIERAKAERVLYPKTILSAKNYLLIEDYKKLLSFIDTLEVKEVDFEKELDRIWFDNKLGNYFDNDALDFAHVRTICKHFFELGLKAQKGE